MYIVKSYLHGEFLESYECDSLEEARGKIKELKYNSMGPFRFKIFKDDEEVEWRPTVEDIMADDWEIYEE